MVMQSLSERPALVGRVLLLIAWFDREDRDDHSTVPVIQRLKRQRQARVPVALAGYRLFTQGAGAVSARL